MKTIPEMPQSDINYMFSALNLTLKPFGRSSARPFPSVRPLSIASRKPVHTIRQDRVHYSCVYICRDSSTLPRAAGATAGVPYHAE